MYASAYGNTASIGDALARGISRTSVKVESINCEFASLSEILDAIKTSNGYLIGSPTLGGHAPTPIISALGNLLSEGNRDNPVGIFDVIFSASRHCKHTPAEDRGNDREREKQDDLIGRHDCSTF